MELPHTAGCIVCGRDNPHGLKLSLHVDPDTGIVSAQYVSQPQHIGFVGIIHGGVLATVLDEIMVWAATWAGKRFCVCGELNVRYRQSVPVGAKLLIQGQVSAVRSRLIETTGSVVGQDGTLYTSASAKYIPLPEERNRQFVQTLVEDPKTSDTLHALRG